MIANPKLYDRDDRSDGGRRSSGRRRASIDTSGPVPLIEGTLIEPNRIAALLDGMTLEELLRDYPSLDEHQVRAAKAYADANPLPAGTFPKITAKKAMRSARAADDFVPPRE